MQGEPSWQHSYFRAGKRYLTRLRDWLNPPQSDSNLTNCKTLPKLKGSADRDQIVTFIFLYDRFPHVSFHEIWQRRVNGKETLSLGPWYFSSPFAMFLRRVCVKILGWLERVTWGRWEVAGRLDSLQFKPREACQPCHLPPNHEVYKPWTLTTTPSPSIQWL